MRQFYWRISLLLILGLTSIGYGLTMLGKTQQLHPALHGFVEGCEAIPQPCWYGIVPRITMTEEIYPILQINGCGIEEINSYYLTAQCQHDLIDLTVEFEERVVSQIILLPQNSYLHTGDFLSLMGLPQRVWFDPRSTLGYFRIIPNYPELSVEFSVTARNYSSLSFHSKIASMSVGVVTGYGFEWRGFIPFWRFCQFEPNYIPCS